MANIYYAKINVNSKINEVLSGKNTIGKQMKRLFEAMNDNTEYKHIITWKEKKELKSKEETYSFSELEKVDDATGYYIYGKLNRIHPVLTEEFDKKTRKSKDKFIPNNSTSIRFYLDLNTEIITFCTRQSFGEKQFLLGFSGITNMLFDDLDFTVFFKSDPFTIEENLRKAHIVYKIMTVIVQPNGNEEELKELYDTDVEKAEKANIHKKTTIFESSRKNTGLNMQSQLIKESLQLNQAYKKVEKGYGRLEFDAVAEDGTEYKYNSDDDSNYVTVIRDDLKDSKLIFIEESKKGIITLRLKEMSAN